jgi:hypothetical protein
MVHGDFQEATARIAQEYFLLPVHGETSVHLPGVRQ